MNFNLKHALTLTCGLLFLSPSLAQSTQPPASTPAAPTTPSDMQKPAETAPATPTETAPATEPKATEPSKTEPSAAPSTTEPSSTEQKAAETTSEATATEANMQASSVVLPQLEGEQVLKTVPTVLGQAVIYAGDTKDALNRTVEKLKAEGFSVVEMDEVNAKLEKGEQKVIVSVQKKMGLTVVSLGSDLVAMSQAQSSSKVGSDRVTNPAKDATDKASEKATEKATDAPAQTAPAETAPAEQPKTDAPAMPETQPTTPPVDKQPVPTPPSTP